MNKFEKYFPLPWESDSIAYLWSANNQTPLMINPEFWTSGPNIMLYNICRIINDVDEPIFENVKYDAEDQIIYIDDKPIFTVRGWGLLNTHLDAKEAAKVQDEMGEWIAKKITATE